jgi:MoaA/NifB/PqqE/SkfB family radical SAM enzyme
VPNKNIFCNTPWYELHIYWDGSLGICCQEDHKLYSGNSYNIATTSIAEWFNSDPVKSFRQRILQSAPLSECRRCYHEEAQGGMSRRIRSNQKSVIFTQAFDDSFEQSPGRKHFDIAGTTGTHPIDIHIDLGNYCNLACKMCNAQASSAIAVQEVKWGIKESKQYVGNDWTRDRAVWDNFKQQLLHIPELNNIHFMGGETLLTDRFEDLVDWLTEHQRFDTCLSFVTNGTVYKPELMAKLQRFRRVGIEVSIETVDEHNAYQRQGTDTSVVLKHIDYYIALGNNIEVCLRPAVSALTIGYHAGLIQYALDKKLPIKSLLVSNPRFLDAEILPQDVKLQYLQTYVPLINQLNTDAGKDYNAMDPTEYKRNLAQHIEMCVTILSTPAPSDSEAQLSAMVDHCCKWDQVYQLDARNLYPELTHVWDRYAY